MKVLAQGDPIEYDVRDPADACRLYREDMTKALIGVVTGVTDYERAQRNAESIRLFSAELDTLRARHAALVDVLTIARRVLGCRRSDPEMHNRLTAFSTALRVYERQFGADAAPEQPTARAGEVG